MQNAKLKVVFFGTPSYVDPIIKTLDKNFDLVGTFRTQQFDNETMQQLSNLSPDIFIVASFGKIIPKEALQIPNLGSINIHPSKLPLYRGPSPIQSQILDGTSESAISFILIDKEMDHGPILYQEDFKIEEVDSFESLCKNMFSASAKILPYVINNFASGNITPKLQQHAIATYCNLVKKEDGYFEIDNPPDSKTLGRMIRAFYPWPTAWTRWKGKIVKLLPEGKIQMEGKNVTDLKSFLNGYPDFPLNAL